MTWTTIPTISAGDKYPAASWNTYIRDNMNDLRENFPAWLSADRLASDFVKTTDVTLADVAGLSFAIGASEIWTFVVFLHILSPTAADIKYALTVPISAAGRYGVHGSRNEIVGDAAIGTNVTMTTLDSTDFAHTMHGTVVNSTTAGTVQLQAAQNASSGTTTIYANSSIVAVKIG